MNKSFYGVWACCVLFLVAGCMTSKKTIPFSKQESYTALGRHDGSPHFSVTGVSNDWVLFPSFLPNGGVVARRDLVDSNGDVGGGIYFRVGFGYSDNLSGFSSNVRLYYFPYDLLLNGNYKQQSDFIKSTKFYEEINRKVGRRDVIVEPVQFRDLKCMAELTARVSTASMGGYRLKKTITCPVVIYNDIGRFVLTVEISNWRDTLDNLQATYSDDYLRLVLNDLEDILRPSIESLIFHVDFSQSPDDLMGYNFPPVPKGMTYTDFYLEIIPEQFHLLSPPSVYPTRRVLAAEDIVKMKLKGLTLSMAKEWHLFFEKSRSERETFLRNSKAPTGRERTEEGIQIGLREVADMARLFSEVIDRWDHPDSAE